MTRLPVISGQACVKALERAGFVFRRQKSSHIRLYRESTQTQITVPDHRELDTGTLRSIIREAGLSVAEFVALLKS